MTTSNPGDPQFCQWEIWQANWEHEDGTTKDRPVLVLSSTRAANANDEIWVAKFTKTLSQTPFRIEFNKSDPSFKNTGLTDTCHLYVAEARKIKKIAMLHKRGKLPEFSATLMGFLMRQALKFKVP